MTTKVVDQNGRKRKSLQPMCPQVVAVSQEYYASLDCPRALTAAILLRYGEYSQLADLRATPMAYASPRAFWLAACASDWLRKYPGLPGFDDTLREETAKNAWYLSEEECGKTNLKLANLTQGTQLDVLLDIAADWFKDLIGPFPCDLAPMFGPGATVSDPATNTTVLDKVSSFPTMTAGLAPITQIWAGTAWERSHNWFVDRNERPYSPTVVEGNVFFCVPKDAQTFRGCAKGPSLNVSYQLPAGQAIRDNLLRRHGYDLKAKQDQHRSLAQTGALTGSLATLDSSRASDTMAYKLIERLSSQHPLWFELLDSLRETHTFIDNEWVPLEKFSAMGNGYTFELETLVFLSLCLAIATARGEDGFTLLREGQISVYGDDVIVPSEYAPEVMQLLSACGFTVNPKKSYSEGPFRESCGGDFFEGVGVNTPKLKKEPVTVADWFSIHNLLYARVGLNKLYTSSRASQALNRVLVVVKDQFPRSYRSMYGPMWLGDTVLHGWYGPQIRARARSVGVLTGPVRPGESHRIVDGNQWVGSIKVLSPVIDYADFGQYMDDAKLAYLLYTHRSSAPARRPVRKMRYQVTNHESDYHVLFMDNPPRHPWWLRQSPYASFFGVK